MNDDPIVVEFRAAIRQFEAVQSQYRAYGAIDTEPRQIFYDLLRKAARGVPAPVPTSGGGWELYSCSMDCSTAAEELHRAANVVLDVVRNCPLGKSAKLQSYIEDYCW
jgi:hypothetical protein